MEDAKKTRRVPAPFLNPLLRMHGQFGPMLTPRTLLPLAFLLLAACGAQPAPHMLGAQRKDVMVDGRQYVVYQKEKTVEVIRLGYARNGEHAAIRAAMIGLIEPTTGCKLNERSLQGDSGEMRGTIRC